MEQADYYIAPSNEIFEDIKDQATKIWNTYDDTYGYRKEKLDRIKDITNIKDNALYIVGMFDIRNQQKLISMVGPDAREYLRKFIRLMF